MILCPKCSMKTRDIRKAIEIKEMINNMFYEIEYKCDTCSNVVEKTRYGLKVNGDLLRARIEHY